MAEEYSIAERFATCCTEFMDIEFVHRETGSTGNHMDVEYIFKNSGTNQKEYVRLELKNFCDTRQNSQKFLNAIGAIIKGRNLPVAEETQYPVVYGLLFLKEHESIVKDLARKSIAPEDWLNLQLVFGCKYVVVFDEQAGEIYYYDWNEFRNSSSEEHGIGGESPTHIIS